MVALYGQTTASDGYRNLIAGYYIDENRELSGMLNVQSIIYDDYDAISPGSIDPVALAAIYTPLTFITSFSSSRVQVYGGFPVRYKFGTLTTQHVNVYGYKDFITYEKQVYKNKLCLVNSPAAEFPPDMSAAPSFDEWNFFSMAAWRFNATTPGFWNEWITSDQIVYDLEPSVIANIGFFYVCYRVFPSNIPPSWFVAGI